jgi:TPR repeat protein
MPKNTKLLPFFPTWVLMAMAIHLFTGTARAGIKEGAAALAAGNGAMAFKELKPLADEGNALAQGLLARIYWVGGSGLPKNRGLAADYAKRALPGLINEAEMANGLAQSTLSVLYREGNGTEKDCVKAVDWAKKSANQNDPFGLNALANLFDGAGSCLSKDGEQAAQMYRKAAEHGHARQQFNLGHQYLYGVNVAKDEQQAMQWFRRAADQGISQAQHALGAMYANGQGVEKNERLAVEWYRKAAEQDDAFGQSSLGLMYETGRGVEKDENQAVKWYRKAADQGHAHGQFALGNMYRSGRGVLKDDQQAQQWYRKAADQGHAQGQFNLGFMYANGHGVPKDFQLAYYWWLLASAQGIDAARNNRDRIEASLTATQRADAQAAAREWKPNSGLQPKAGPSDGPPKEARRAPPPATQSRDSSGTAWAVTRTQLMTNAHVVDGCSRLEAQGLGPVQVQAVDPQSDLALLTVANNPTVATLRGSRLRQGEAVTVIGYPLAGMLASGANVTGGNVSALAGMQNDTRHIQITAPVQPGNSGGPLLDASGHVVGVVVSKLNALKVAKATGDIPQNVNFAVSLFTLQGFLEANGVNYATAPSNKNMATADVAEIGKRFTVLLECFK